VGQFADSCEQGRLRFQDFSEVILESIQTSVSSMLPVESIGVVN
jgi:hypothetical protein